MAKFTVMASGPQGSGKSTAMGVIEDALHSAGYVTTTTQDSHMIEVRTPAGKLGGPVWTNADRIAMLNNRVTELSRRLDALTHATSAPEPIQAAETPDALATRLLGDPAMLAGVLNAVAGRMTQNHRWAIHEEIQKMAPRAGSYPNGLRLLAATIAAGSFGK